MKIVHVAPASPYNNYWGYQENLLPKYQKLLGHDVALIITNRTQIDGQIIETSADDYVLDDGVRVIRLPQKKYRPAILTGIFTKLDISKYLLELKPDYIFFHGLVSLTINQVVKYKRKDNPNCVIVQDNHLDYNIGNSTDTLKRKALRSFYRILHRKTQKYIDRVYGVTPWRKTYAEDYYHADPKKTDVLIMGADDEKIKLDKRDEIRKSIRGQLGLTNEFLVVTGGKIDEKKKIHLLMEACQGLENVKLLVFGSVEKNLQPTFDELIERNKNIIYIGWINAEDVYGYFFASDLVFFPGQHSVLWEQACASKTPCVFEKWEGMEHVNNGGNSDFVSPITVDSLRKKLEELVFSDKYYTMKRVAESEATDIYLYSNIAKKSLECCGSSAAKKEKGKRDGGKE